MGFEVKIYFVQPRTRWWMGGGVTIVTQCIFSYTLTLNLLTTNSCYFIKKSKRKVGKLIIQYEIVQKWHYCTYIVLVKISLLLGS